MSTPTATPSPSCLWLYFQETHCMVLTATEESDIRHAANAAAESDIRTLETELARLRAERAEAEVQAFQNNNLYHRGHSAGYAEAKDDCEAELLRMANRAEKLKKLWKEFITLMEITEESNSGNAFNPNKISSCRAMDGKRLNEILIEARQIIF